MRAADPSSAPVDPQLDDAYAAAWQEWETTGEAAAWEGTTADGLADAAR